MRDSKPSRPKVPFRRDGHQYIQATDLGRGRCEGLVMDAGVLEPSAWRRNVPCFLAAALLAAVCLGTRTALAAECDPHCNRRVHPSQYSDPRCELRRVGPHLERVETRCDLREPRRKADQHAPSVTQHPPSPTPPSLGQVPVISTGDPGRQQSRSVDRDVGFDDAFTTQANPVPGAGVRGINADAARRAPPGRR